MVLAFWLPAILILYAGCGNKAEVPSGALEVCVTIPPQAYFLERVGGAHIQVQTLVAPGQDVHTFAPMPGQMTALARARVFFTVGVPFETGFIGKVRGMNPGLQVVDSAAGIVRRPAEPDPDEPAPVAGHGTEGDRDPHVWLDPLNARIIAANMAAGLKAADPAHAADYDANLAVFSAEMVALDTELAAALAPLKGRDFFVFHPAFGYFGDRYGLRQVAVETGGKEPTGKQLAALIDRSRAAGVKVIFVQPQFPSRSADAVAREIGGVVVPMDDLARDYPANLRDMAARVRAALGQ
ncbi:MAG: zinc ABC transporter substrate-binding protein [Planctomycetota bacterium]